MPIQYGLGGGGGSGPAGMIKVGTAADPDIGERGAWEMAQQRQQAENQRRRDAAQFGYQTNLAGQQNAAEAARQAAQLQLGREQLGQQSANQRAQIEASLAPTRFAQTKFNAVFPWVQRTLGSFAGGGWGTAGYQGQGAQGQQPAISDAPVYSQGQVQQQVNAGRAQNDAATADRQRALSQRMAGRGFGTNSPLAMALSNSLFQGNLATNTGAEQDLRWKAAQGNASQVLEAQKARETQYASRQDEDIRRNQVVRNQQSALLASLLGSL